MAGSKRSHDKQETGSISVNLGDLLSKRGQRDKPKEEPKKEVKVDKLGQRVDAIKARAKREKYPWTSSIEKKLRAQETMGDIKRAWREYLVGVFY